MPPIIIIIIVLALAYILYFFKQEKNKEIAMVKRMNEIREYHKAVQNEAEKFEYIFVENFPFSNCSKCDDSTFSLKRFNLSYTSIEVKCCTCGKLVWLKSDSDHSSKLKEINENLVTINSTYYDDPYDISDLDLEITVKTIITEDNDTKRKSIPTKTKQEVWQRDEGKCVECGSNEKLEYDHIIPVSKGGANTVRNIQLLRENCNRTKSAKVM